MASSRIPVLCRFKFRKPGLLAEPIESNSSTGSFKVNRISLRIGVSSFVLGRFSI